MKQLLEKVKLIRWATGYPWLWLIALATFIGLFALLSFDGFYFYDDFNYMGYAAEVCRGTFQLRSEIFNHRFGVFVPVGLLYCIFGISEWSSLAWPFICTVATPLLCFFLLRRHDVLAAVLAALFSGLEFYPIFFANKLLPDPIASTLSLLTLFLIYKMRCAKHTGVFGIFASIALLATFLTKVTAIYLMPFLLFILITDVRHRRNSFAWGLFVATFLWGTAAVLTSYKLLTGDALFILHSIQDNHYVDVLSYFDKPVSAVLHRITWQPVAMFMGAGMGVIFIMSLSGIGTTLVHLFKGTVLQLHWPEQFFGLAAIGMLITFWFCTTSFRYYNPIPLSPRMVFSIVPVLSILAALRLSKAIRTGIWSITWAMLMFVAALWLLNGSNWQLGILMLGWAAIALSGYLWGRKSIFLKMALPAMLLLLLIHPLYTMLKPQRKDYFEEKKAMANLTAPRKPTVVLTDSRLVRAHSYYYNFEVPENIRFIDFAEAEAADIAKASHVYILKNEETVRYLAGVGFTVRPNQFVNAIEGDTVYAGNDVILLKLPR